MDSFVKPAIFVDLDFWHWYIEGAPEGHGSTYATVKNVEVRGMDRLDNVSAVEHEIMEAINGILERHQK